MANERLRLLLARLRERLWVRPLGMGLLSLLIVFAAVAADGTGLRDLVPDFDDATVRSLLSVLSASMLVVATFTVGSMVAAYASASSTATPRAFLLILADDTSQNALSTFIGAFIFSVVALIALEQEAFQVAGRFVIFSFSVVAFGLVVLTFIRWVDRIARLGRIGSTIETVERAAVSALRRRREAPTMRACRVSSGDHHDGTPVHAPEPGYVRHVDLRALQACAEDAGARIVVEALPGTFVGPGRPLARIVPAGAGLEPAAVARAFSVGRDRAFDDDPRFGLVVLSEIAARALSPAVNDPGTAIQVLSAHVRLLTVWSEAANPPDEATRAEVVFDRVEVPTLSVDDLLDDAFTPIARDGAGTVEVAVRLQKALGILAATGDAALRSAALRHQRIALARAAQAMRVPEDLEAVRRLTSFAAGHAGRSMAKP